MQLGLGTVQFGLDYGIANAAGRTPADAVPDILRTAAEGGVGVLDTAAAYGCSEEVLGKALLPGHSFRIVTKTMPTPDKSPLTPDALRASLEGSLERLGREAVDGYLVHHVRELLSPGGRAMYDELAQLKAEGLVGKIGVSVYEGEEIDAVLADFDIDLIQLPLNVFDQRLPRSGRIARLAERGVEVHVRSIFLQGLALMAPERVPAHFAPVMETIDAYHAHAAELGLTPVQAALAYGRSVAGADVILVGVDTREQLAANISDFVHAEDFSDAGWERFAIDDPQFVNPSKWKLDA